MMYKKIEKRKASYEKFEKLLEEHNVTAYRVGKEAEVPLSTLSDWKNLRSIPKTDKLLKIADYFDVPLDYFVRDDYESVDS